MFKNEIFKRFLSDYIPTILFILENDYLDELTVEEFESLMVDFETESNNLDNSQKSIIKCIALFNRAYDASIDYNKLLERKAKDLFEEILKTVDYCPNNYILMVTLGTTFYGFKLYDKAIKTFIYMLHGHPLNSRIWKYLAKTYKAAGNIIKAKFAFLKVIYFNPSDSEACFSWRCQL